MISLFYAGNNKIFDCLTLSLMSIAKNTTESLNVYVLTINLTKLNKDYAPITVEQVETLNKILQTYNSKNNVTRVELKNNFKSWVKHNANLQNAYTPFAMLRLFADQIKELPNKIIYLDCDIMAKGDIKELFDVDIKNYEVAVTRDRYAKFFISPNYFNSGVMLMNIKNLKANDMFLKARKMCAEKKMKFPDQTAMNKIIKRKLYLPRRFNEQGDMRADTILKHFSNRINWFKFKLIKIKQNDIKKVQNVYKIHDFDEIYKEFFKFKKQFNF